MSSFDFTTTGLLASVKRRGMLPSTNETLATADFLSIADDEIQTYIVPLLLEAREEYLVATYDVTTVANTAAYPIPPRAMGAELRNVQYSDPSSNFRQLHRIEPERTENYGLSGSVVGYYFEGNNLVVVPTPSSGGVTVRMKCYQRPNRLVQTSAVGTITAINTGTKTVTTSATIPSTFTTSVTYDLVKATPGFDCQAIDQTVTAASGTSISFTNSLPSGLAVGDYVCLAGESPVPQIPADLHPLLAQRVAAKALEALGSPGAGAAFQVAEGMRKQALALITPRSAGSARVLVNFFGPGFHSRRSGRWRVGV